MLGPSTTKTIALSNLIAYFAPVPTRIAMRSVIYLQVPCKSISIHYTSTFGCLNKSCCMFFRVLMSYTITFTWSLIFITSKFSNTACTSTTSRPVWCKSGLWKPETAYFITSNLCKQWQIHVAVWNARQCSENLKYPPPSSPHFRWSVVWLSVWTCTKYWDTLMV